MKAHVASHAPNRLNRPASTAGSRSLVRHAPDAISTLPDVQPVRIEVNGTLAGVIHAVLDAPRELAVGWAFTYGFFDSASELGQVTVDGGRVSLMAASGEDVDRRRHEAVGWTASRAISIPTIEREEPIQVRDDDLMDVIDATWYAFRRDGAAEGYVHAAAASGDHVHCVARDTSVEMAAAKVLGWMLLECPPATAPVLLVGGPVSRRIVDSAARAGFELIVTSALPDSEAYRAALGYSVSLVGNATSPAARLLVDSGHVLSEHEDG